MRAGSGEGQGEPVGLLLVDQEPIGLKVTLPVTGVVSGEGVIPVLGRKGLFLRQKIHHMKENIRVFALLYDPLIVLFEL